jgi:hypothetical protein
MLAALECVGDLSMKRILLLSVIVLVFLSGCMLLQPLPTMTPPAWIQGTWSYADVDGGYTFTATTVLSTIGLTTLDVGKMYRDVGGVTEIITDTLYSFTVPGETDDITYEFRLEDANTIQMTMRVGLSSIGPVPLYRQ